MKTTTPYTLQRHRLTMLTLGASLLAFPGASVLAADYQEAPQLAEQVKAGTLPPVEQRLPETPFVLEPIESVGTYGGVWRSALKGTYDHGWIRRTVAYQPLVAFSLDWSEVVPNVAESFEVNDEATEFTFHLRKGHKWSDGEPFTTADLDFVLNDISKNPEYKGEKVPNFNWDNMTGEVIDETTYRITLDQPDGLLIQRLASVDGPFLVLAPKHYCGQFVPSVNPDAESLATEQGFDSWSQALEKSCFTYFTDEKRPSLNAWQQTTAYDGLNQIIEFERNPYFYKVDTAGNQLPYIDKATMLQSENVEDILLKVINGEVDFSNRHFATVTNKPVIYDSQESGNYRLTSTVDARMNHAILQLNLNNEDPVKRALYNERDFRVALSLATDREEIVDVIFAGQGKPFQAAPRPESPYYHETLATQYTEYDPDKADELLDGLGLTERNDDGIRLNSDGEPITIQLYTPSDQIEFNDMAQLIVNQWAEVGIVLDQRNVERSFVYERLKSNQHDMHIWWGDGGLGDAMLDPRYYFPFNQESGFAYRWAQWFNNPDSAAAEEPSAPAKEQMDLYRQLKTSGDPAQQAAIFKQILDISAEQFWVLGTVLPAEGYAVVNKKLGNVPESQPYAWLYPQPAPMGTSQLFYKD